MFRFVIVLVPIGLLTACVGANSNPIPPPERLETNPPIATSLLIPNLDSIISRSFDGTPPRQAFWAGELGQVLYTPTGKLYSDIDLYCKNITDARLLELETKLRGTNNPAIAWLALVLIARCENPHASEALQRYGQYFDSDPKLYAEGYINRSQIGHVLHTTLAFKIKNPTQSDIWFHGQ